MANWELINSKISVAKINDASVHQTREGTVSKQQVIIRDATSTCSLCLYGDDVDKLEIGKTYFLKNLRLRIVKNNAFLNTTRAEVFSANEVEPFTKLADVPPEEMITDVTMNGKITGVSSVSQKYQCSVCSKEIAVIENNFGKCESCSIRFLLSSISYRWSLVLAIQDVCTNDVHALYFDNDQSHSLAKIVGFPLDKEDEVASTLFNQIEPCKITFNITNKTVIHVEKIL